MSVVALSYDNQEIVSEFTERAGVKFPVLADPDSSSLHKLKLVNPDGKGMTKGVAFPGLILLNEKGQIEETFFEDSYAVRPTADSVLAALFPNLSKAEPLPKGKKYRLTQTGDTGIAGTTLEVEVDFPLSDKAHLYAPGNTTYQPLSLELRPHPMLQFGEIQRPESEVLRLEAIGESVPVYSGRVRLKVPVAVVVNDQTKTLKEPADVEIVGRLKYQICTDKTCLMPMDEEIRWKLQVKPLDRKRSKESNRH